MAKVDWTINVSTLISAIILIMSLIAAWIDLQRDIERLETQHQILWDWHITEMRKK